MRGLVVGRRPFLVPFLCFYASMPFSRPFLFFGKTILFRAPTGNLGGLKKKPHVCVVGGNAFGLCAPPSGPTALWTYRSTFRANAVVFWGRGSILRAGGARLDYGGEGKVCVQLGVRLWSGCPLPGHCCWWGAHVWSGCAFLGHRHVLDVLLYFKRKRKGRMKTVVSNTNIEGVMYASPSLRGDVYGPRTNRKLYGINGNKNGKTDIRKRVYVVGRPVFGNRKFCRGGRGGGVQGRFRQFS